MSRADFNLLTDEEIRSALYVAAQALSVKLLPRLKTLAPELRGDKLPELEVACLKALADHHGVTELLSEAEAE